MHNQTRVLLNAYLEQVAKLNGIPDATTKFTVSPAVQQTMENKIQESSQFLSSINVMPVSDQEGEKIGLGVSGTVASTTDTTQADRQTTDLTSLADMHTYRCEQTNFDTHIRYATLDAWARFPDFQTRLRDAILQRQALDRMTIGFNGVARAATSNRAANPLLQDVNKGWLQQYRDNAAARVMNRGAAAGVLKVGAGGDYANLDALVYDVVNNLLDAWYQEDPSLVVICGRKLLHDKYFPIISQATTNVERVAADMVISQKRIGGLPAVRVPFFPANAVMVTSLKNLSMYYQDGTRRRTVLDNAKRDRIENYESGNEAYVVEDYGFGGVAENIQLV